MNEELLAELEAELVEVPDEVVETAEEKGAEEGKEKEPEEFRPWETEAKTDEVPEEFKALELNDKWRTERLNKEITAKKEAQERLAERDREIAELRAKVAAPAKAATAEDLIDMTKYPDTAEGAKQYIADLRAAERKIAEEESLARIERTFARREMQTAVQAQVKEITEQFDARVSAAKERNPDVAKAEAYIDAKAEHVDARVLRELMLDENAGDLMLALATNKAHHDVFFGADPDKAIRLMHKLSAKIEFEQERGTTSAKQEQPVPPASPKAVVADMVPKTAKTGGSSSVQTDPNKMTTDELRKYLNKRK